MQCTVYLTTALPTFNPVICIQQVALLSQRSRAMLCVSLVSFDSIQCLERSILLLVTAASYLT